MLVVLRSERNMLFICIVLLLVLVLVLVSLIGLFSWLCVMVLFGLL